MLRSNGKDGKDYLGFELSTSSVGEACNLALMGTVYKTTFRGNVNKQCLMLSQRLLLIPRLHTFLRSLSTVPCSHLIAASEHLPVRVASMVLKQGVIVPNDRRDKAGSVSMYPLQRPDVQKRAQVRPTGLHR